MAGPSCNGDFTEDEEILAYRKDSNMVVTFQIIYDLNNLGKNNCLSFKPVMSHQIFGENESIFGYRSLAITLSYLHNSARCFVNIKSSGKIKDDVHKPDDIMESLNPWLPENYASNEKDFITMFDTENHNLIHGTILYEYKDKQRCQLFPNDEVYSTFKITQCNLNDEEFKSFHARFETIVIWFIDGANFIDLDDEKWEIFYVFEEFQHPKTQQIYTTPIGFCTVYKFFAYPQNIRSRISQFFVIPTHQRRGIGTALYKTIFKYLQSKPEVIDITVEEPTSNFQRIRDVHDSCLVKKTLEEIDISVMKSPSKKIFNVLKELKIGKKQSRRVFDILSGIDAIASKDMYNQYLNNIKKRIQTEVKEKMKGVKRMRDIDGGGVVMELSDESTMIETEFKRYKEDLETSIQCFKKCCSF